MVGRNHREYRYRSISKRKNNGGQTAGCMSGMLHLFDFHHIHLFTGTTTGATTTISTATVHDHDYDDEISSSPADQLRGVEAPRNSLELLDAEEAVASPNLADFDYYGGFPVAIRIKKKRKDLRSLVEEEKRCSSQLAETPPHTPSVVARLMGLDILPDHEDSPKFSIKNEKRSTTKQCKGGSRKEAPPLYRRQPLQKMDSNIINLPDVRSEMECRSVPETPRASSERSYRNEENRDKYNVDRGYSLPPSPPNYMNKRRDENKRPSSQYSERERMKETSNGRGQRSPPSLSPPTPPQHRYFPQQLTEPQVPPKLPRPLAVGFFRAERQNFDDKPITSMGSMSKLKKDCYERRFTERIRKQAPPSTEIVVNRPDAFKASMLPPPPPPPSSSSNSEKIKSCSIEPTKRRSEAFYQPKARTASQQMLRDSKEQDPEFLYVRSILQRAGIMCTSRVRWYSPSLPIDPYIFHQLERDLPLLIRSIKAHDNGPLRHCCNRKLLFHLVQDLLIDLLTWSSTTTSTTRKSSPLIERLWSQIQSLPLANCQVIGDIDALVAGDLVETKVRRLLRHPSVVAEAEGMVFEIESDVLDSIIGEAAASLALCSKL